MNIPVAAQFPMTQRAIDGPYLYFVTSNTTLGQRFFDDSKKAESLGELINRTCAECEFTLFAFCILPNHVHLLVRKNGDKSLSQLMHFIKGRYWRLVGGGRFWQPRFNFRIIGTEEYMNNVVDYIAHNYFKMNLGKEYGLPPYVFINWKAFE